MLKINDSCNAPLRFLADDGTTIGQFYNSWDKQYHLASYTPYYRTPSKYLCGNSGNFSPSRDEGQTRKGGCCPVCSAELKSLMGGDDQRFAEFGFV